MVELIEGVVKVVPDPRATPPVEDAYQLIVPELAVADKSSVPASHLLAPLTLVIVGVVTIVAVTIALVALVHVALAASAK